MQLNNTNTLVNNFLWPIILFVFGMSMVIYQTLGFDLSVMPGDLGDGRFNSYILEHGYQYLIQDNLPYWNAPFFFPEKDVISYSDNLFGALPIYVLCRFWTDRETAFQLWYLILIGLNFWGSYYAIRKLNFSVYASSVGAFIYTFSLIIAIQTAHIQMLPRFTAPFAIVSFYLWLHQKNNNYFYIAIFLLAYQYYCGVYLGYFLLYIYIIIAAIYFVKEQKVDVLLQLVNTKSAAIRTTIVLFGALCLMAIFFYPYYLRSLDGGGYPSFSDIKYYSPRLWSYFYVHERSVLWGWSSVFIDSAFNLSGNGSDKSCIFIGALPYVFLVAAYVMYRRDGLLKFFLIALLAIFLFTLIFFDISLYAFIIYLIPGARAIRAVSRFITIAIFLWSIIAAFFLDRFLSNLNTYKIVLIFALPLLLVLDNMYLTKPIPALKSNFQKRSRMVVEKYEKLKHTNPGAKAFALNLSNTAVDDHKYNKRRVHFHLDAMMASLVIGLPCVNGYSAKTPPDYLEYFLSPNKKNLDAWLQSDRVRITVKEKYKQEDILILE
ncbi:hypothetical protein [Cytophaga aurantiaca]|uniref:hypothetical protein n=1 Tax=Cytophaga aurantiaca TaxID=29530 RepID=UPI00035F67AF|nr:hypothetical protein [Cytophaga aurantiaca]